MELLNYRIRTLFKYRDLILELVKRDLKLKYRRSVLGYVWSILQPLLYMIVLVIVFSNLLGKKIENYPVYLLSGRLMYDFLKTSTNSAMKSVTGNASLLQKVYVPKYVFTLARVTSAMVDMVLSFGALIIVMIATGARFYPTLLFTPLVVVQIYLFCCGLGFFLAQFNVFFRDVEHIYSAVLTAWFYVTPIIYEINRLPANVIFFVKAFNPLYYYVAQFRDLVYYGNFPGPRIFWGGWLIAFLMLAFGTWTFQRSKDRFVLYI
ncbi:MAG: ABC transporter permease [Lachnospiraceae bacterium]|nr:ABC transporter permease [Lachnospiraceae bacterium]